MDPIAINLEPVMVTAGQRNVMNVPYTAQLGSGADAHFNDCGAACSAMLIEAYTGATIPVDVLFSECIPGGDVSLSAIQLMNVLQKHGVKTEWKAFLEEVGLYKILSAKKPFIALILYGVLVNAGLVELKNFRGFHFVVVVGIDTDSVIINDPLYTSPAGKKVVIPLAIFMQAWREAGADPQANPACGAIIPIAPLTERSIAAPLSAPVVGTKYRVTASDGLNVRSGPGINFQKVGGLSFGALINVEKVDAGWAKIAGSDELYVFANWIEKV